MYLIILLLDKLYMCTANFRICSTRVLDHPTSRQVVHVYCKLQDLFNMCVWTLTTRPDLRRTLYHTTTCTRCLLDNPTARFNCVLDSFVCTRSPTSCVLDSCMCTRSPTRCVLDSFMCTRSPTSCVLDSFMCTRSPTSCVLGSFVCIRSPLQLCTWQFYVYP